jgi:amphi-Trp domain-containing protein
MKKHEVTVKCKMESAAIADLLIEMANSFREGKVVVQKESSFVALNPTGQIEVELEASEKKGKQKIEIQMSWKEEMVAEKLEESFCISCHEPCPELSESEEQTEKDQILFRKW